MDGKRRLKVVIHESYFHQFAGAQKTGLYLAAGLGRDRFDPLLVTTGEGVLAEKARGLGVRVKVHIPPCPLNEFGGTLLRRGVMEKMHILLRKVLPYNLAFRDFLDEERPDILIFNTARSSLLLPFMRVIGSFPVVTYLQSAIDLGWTVRRIIRWSSDFFILVAGEIASVYDLPESRFRVVPNGICPDFASGSFSLPPGDLVKLPGRKWMVAVGNVVPYKGHLDLLRAFACVAGEVPEWDLIIVGSTTENPSWSQRLESESAGLGIASRVHWTGWVEDVRTYLAAADLFVLPSHVEGLSYALMEAMAFGLPTVVSDVSGAGALLGDDGEGIIVPPRDENALAQALLEAVAIKRRDSHFGRRNASRIGRSFTRAAMCERVGEILWEVVAGRERK